MIDISLDSENIELAKDAQHTFTVTPNPSAPSDTVTYNWSTSNPFVLSENGKYEVTVEFEDGASFKFADANWGNEISTLNGEAAANFSGGNGSNLVCNVPGEYTYYIIYLRGFQPTVNK